MDEGESIQTVVENLTDSYGFSRTRARATAITETLTAHSYAKEEAIRQSPAVDRKEWVHTGEHKIKPRPHHQANPPNGQIVAKNDNFTLEAPNGTYYPRFPRDTELPASERVNCHCIHRAIVNEDILGLSLADRRALQQEAIDNDNFVWELELNASNRAAAGIEKGTTKFTTYGRILKVDTQHHYITGIVYEPMTEDSHGNFMTEEEIVKAAYWFAKNGDKVDLQHSFEELSDAFVVETWVNKADTVIEGEEIKKGTWLITVEISDPDVWDKVQKGELTGFSMGGVGKYSDHDVDISGTEKGAGTKQ